MTSPIQSLRLDGFVPVPDDVAAGYRKRGLWRGVRLGDLPRVWADRWPDRPAVLGHSALTFAELDERVGAAAAGFVGLGLGPHDRVIVQMPNTADFPVVLFGLLRCGALPVLCLPGHREAELTHLATLASATALITADIVAGFDHRELAARVCADVPAIRHVVIAGEAGPYRSLAGLIADHRHAAGEDWPGSAADPSEPALLLISGGTTGRPKLIPRTHDDYDLNARASADVCGLTADDVYMATLPSAHNFPLACPGIIGALGVGAAVHLLADPSPESAFAAIERHRVTVTAVVPPLAQLWVAATEWEDADLSSLRLLQVGGAKLAAVTARAIPDALGCTVQQVFGMAEGLLNYTRSDDSAEVVATTQGRPLLAEDEILVVDTEGRPVTPGTVGELLTRGPYTIRGYYRAAEHNRRAFTADGFYRSGDLVQVQPSGHLVVTGRVKDVVNRGGEGVPADELEQLLLGHPDIRDAAVIGLPDATLGERVCAVVVPRAAVVPTLAGLIEHLRASGLATFKFPDSLQVLDALPLTAVGKIDKKALVVRFTAT
ncbi:AMP-binding protein [Dactylosporangium sp. NPDC005572]|uniref:(2,3-dihydroxybenzoyl)adenylate synthase n=1 Tax=Dactylosporangium sp. NPDC005572 TaxID=3156889 RepID=UPI0033B22600